MDRNLWRIFLDHLFSDPNPQNGKENDNYISYINKFKSGKQGSGPMVRQIGIRQRRFGGHQPQGVMVHHWKHPWDVFIVCQYIACYVMTVIGTLPFMYDYRNHVVIMPYGIQACGMIEDRQEGLNTIPQDGITKSGVQGWKWRYS